jgi:hypothetical protein
MGNSICGRDIWRQRVPVFEGYRLPSTGSRWDKRWGSGRVKILIVFCAFQRGGYGKVF